MHNNIYKLYISKQKAKKDDFLVSLDFKMNKYFSHFGLSPFYFRYSSIIF